ncbi:MAG: lamin tail domain-containing protein [Anaerolineales bacterium]|nr:lamin tail domain-containing protein [Anaerolineales bacterium]
MAQIWDVLRPVCLLLLTGSVIPGWIHIKPQPEASVPARRVWSIPLAADQPAANLSSGTWPVVWFGQAYLLRIPTVCGAPSALPWNLFSASGDCGSIVTVPTAQVDLSGDTIPAPAKIPATFPAITPIPLLRGSPLIPVQQSEDSAPRRKLLGAVVLPGGSSLQDSFQQSPATDTPTFTPTAAGTDTNLPTLSPSSSPTPTPSACPSASGTNTTLSPSPTGTTTPPPTAGATSTPSPTSTASTVITPPTPTASPENPPPESKPTVLINEIAWAGTLASAYDEWLELYNPGVTDIVLDGWLLSDGNDIEISLKGSIPAGGYYLLERSDDGTINTLAANIIYTGTLHNAGESLLLQDDSGSIVDTANTAGGDWPAGLSSSRASMERICAKDDTACWQTCGSFSNIGMDADGNPVPGSPLEPSSPVVPTRTPTSTLSVTPKPVTATPVVPLTVLINEVAWAGTLASASDEWIELSNPGEKEVNLAGWSLTDGNNISIQLEGTIHPAGYFLLERTDDNTITSIPADQLFSGTLSNQGEFLILTDSFGTVIDTAGREHRSWPYGSAGSRTSMERKTSTGSHQWGTYPGYGGNGLDADGKPVQGTPRSANAVLLPTPKPDWVPNCVVINEVLIRPKYDWEGTGGVTTDDEFIELLNTCDRAIFLKSWYLDDVQDAGSRPFRIPGITLRPGSFAVFFRSQTRIALNDNGDDVRLLSPDMVQVNRISYDRVRAYNLSYGRLPDGTSRRVYGLWPTPGEPNILYVEPVRQPVISVSAYCSLEELYSFRLSRLSRSPAQTRLLLEWGLSTCPKERIPAGFGP